MEKKTKIVIAIASILGIGFSVFLIVKARRKNAKSNNGDSKSKSSDVDKTKNYVIGDSQTPLIDKNSQKVTTIGEQGEASLWKSGKGLKWLKDAVDAYQESKDVNSIVINIGTNGPLGSRRTWAIIRCVSRWHARPGPSAAQGLGQAACVWHSHL
jgi:hypothetical protein